MPTEREALDHLARNIEAAAPPVAIGSPGYQTDELGRPVADVKGQLDLLTDCRPSNPDLARLALFPLVVDCAWNMLKILEGNAENMPNTYMLLTKAKELL